MLRDYPDEAIGGNQTKTTQHTRRTVTPPQRCVFTQQILAWRAAEVSGQRGEATKLANKLIASSRGFIRRMAQRYVGSDVDRADVEAVATMAFWQAATTWRPDGGSPFDTWARWGMRMALQKMIRGSRIIRGVKRDRVDMDVTRDDGLLDEATVRGWDLAKVRAEWRGTAMGDELEAVLCGGKASSALLEELRFAFE